MSGELRFTGGTSLEALARSVAELAGGTARRRAVGALATALRAEVRTAFSTQRSPAGTAWDPPARPQRHALLVKSKALRAAALRVLFFGGGVRVVLPWYGDLQQSGKGPLPARPFLPEDPMPPSVVERFNRAVTAAVKL